ncbi:hypothetical protein GCM10027275_38720 [Rhabdobacter roseus]|uniref:Uncharacterized protein n=1 Tax=Rhabdobacter roseus TaxID=1655419 RepID=A0A840TQH1_9BACT|nr:type VI secretion system tube protein TssD [Rhabdobacter roseus]MBB5285574.1 hypothetical protein [Rhabdobacter roseus]
MANKATLSIAGEEFSVLEFSLSLKQKYNAQGKPASGVYLGDFYLILNAGSDFFFEWQTEHTRMESGKITTYRTDQDSKFIEYAFEQGFITSILESFYADEGLANTFNQIGTTEDVSSVMFEYGMNVLNDAKDPEVTVLKAQRNMVRDFQKRTGIAYCMFISLSSEKLKIRDIDHDNMWS